MIEVVWEFVVKPEAVARFQELYGTEGAWAALFRRYPGFGGTRLLQDSASRQRFLTVDSWESESQFAEMRRSAQEEYARLDAECENLTLSEREIGVFRRAS
jgi:heme-degrading monooxygenase HmoA